MYRYRYQRGTSRGVDPNVLDRLGVLQKVVAKRFRSTRSNWRTEVYWCGERIWDGFSKREMKRVLFSMGLDLDQVSIRKVMSFWTTTYEVVMVYGDKGTARFSGCCWGYSGEGPRTTHMLLLKCGVPKDVADIIAFQIERKQTVGIDWELDLTKYHQNVA